MNRKQRRIADRLAAQQHVKERRAIALRVFHEVDELVDREIARSVENGRKPSCSRGCSHC